MWKEKNKKKKDKSSLWFIKYIFNILYKYNYIKEILSNTFYNHFRPYLSSFLKIMHNDNKFKKYSLFLLAPWFLRISAYETYPFDSRWKKIWCLITRGREYKYVYTENTFENYSKDENKTLNID